MVSIKAHPADRRGATGQRNLRPVTWLVVLVSMFIGRFEFAWAAEPIRGGAYSIETVNATTVGIMSGGIGGTYARMVQDMADTFDEANVLRVVNMIGKGSVQNIIDLMYLRSVDMALVQSDVLGIAGNGDESLGLPKIPDIEKNVTYIAKLHSEVVHVLARRQYNEIAELGKKVVAVGPRGSGSAVTARVIFRALDIHPELVYMPYQQALAEINNGGVDALLYVAGKPAEFFRQIEVIENNPTVRLLDIPWEPKLGELYSRASLDTTDYPAIVAPDTPVSTVAVPSVLAVFNHKPKTPRFEKTKLFSLTLARRIGELKAKAGISTHMRWNDVKMSDEVPGWKRFGPVEAWVKLNTLQ